MQGRLLWDSDFTQKAQDSTVYLKIRPYYFYLVQALQSSTHYLKWRVLFSVLPFLYLSQMRRKEVSTRRRWAVKVCFMLMSSLFSVLLIFREQAFLLQWAGLCFLLTYHAPPKVSSLLFLNPPHVLRVSNLK